jgi:hypothetical protein
MAKRGFIPWYGSGINYDTRGRAGVPRTGDEYRDGGRLRGGYFSGVHELSIRVCNNTVIGSVS